MINLILAAIPALGSAIFGGKGDKVIEAATNVAKEVFGTSDEAEIAKKLETDPALAGQFKAKLEAQTAALQQEAEMYRTQVEDTINARATFGASFNWAQLIVGGLVTGGFFTVITMFIVRPITMSTEVLTVLNIMIGILGQAFGQVVNYHFGSSAGSAQKDGVIGQLKQSILKKM
jgi:hypothetical protein